MEEWKLISYNDTNYVIGENGAWPIKPGDIITALLVDTEKEARSWLECWKKVKIGHQRKVELFHKDQLLETHIIEKKSV